MTTEASVQSHRRNGHPPGRADFLGWPKALLPVDEQVRRLENRVKQLEAIVYGTKKAGSCQRCTALKRFIATYYSIPWRDLSGRTQKRPAVEARQIAIWLCDRVLGLSQCSIAEFFGRRNRTTVGHAIGVINDRLETEPKFRANVAWMQKQVEAIK